MKMAPPNKRLPMYLDPHEAERVATRTITQSHIGVPPCDPPCSVPEWPQQYDGAREEPGCR